jgi:two-component system NarL family response regulator
MKDTGLDRVRFPFFRLSGAHKYKGDYMADIAGIGNANRGGRHSSGQPEKKIRVAGPLIREILRSSGHIAKPNRYDRSRNLPSPVPPDLLEKDHEESRMVSVLLVDDHPIVREGLASVIGRQPEMQVVEQAADGREALEKFTALRPDVVLVDLRMPGMDGIQTVSAICAAAPGARVVILTTYQDEEDVYRVLQAGARGYILKSAPIVELVECIKAVKDGRTWVPPQVGAMLARRVSAPELTRREGEVLQSIAAGKSNKEIGVALDISEGTVKVHVTNILQKLKVAGRTEAVGTAIKRGLVRIELPAAA